MKKFFTSFVTAMFAFIAFAAPFGITVNGTPVIGTENPTPMDPSYLEWSVLGQSLQAGDIVKLYDEGSVSEWAVDLDPAITVSITGGKTEGFYTMGEGGTFNFYIKLKTGADQLWVEKAGDEPTPGPTPTPGGDKAWYIYGWIGGADYNGDDYPFVNGVADISGITADPSTPSYVFVHEYNSGIDYMTNGWAGEVRSVVMYDVSTIASGHDKLMLPAGAQNLYLVENADGSVTVSLDPSPTPGPTPGDNAWYIYGWIGGADYNGEDYPFINGVADISSITADPSTPSYVFVHEYNSGIDYMTNGWAGEVRSVVMYDVPTIASGHDKLMLPTGAQNLYIAENADGSVTVSLDPLTSDNAPADDADLMGVVKIETSKGLYLVYPDGVVKTLMGVNTQIEY